ncbi:hypothetical protein VTJ83DRAFT_5531 [Remersonia thermophila]|uniref:Uncharacterized protein n=1 Tax=Remersonia thermophila TaxID=72144 RepID=A0ABR4D813_9PEZI
MFLHSGASLRGHEYSSRPSVTTLQSSPNLRKPLLRSAFAPPKQREAIRIGPDGSPAPVLRQRPASDYIPRESSPAVRFRIPHEEDDDNDNDENDDNNDDDDPSPQRPSAHDESAAMSESELSDTTLSHDGASVSRLSGPSRHHKGPRRAARRPSTTYYLGYPAPRIIGKTKVVQKVFLPRLLLQLQTISADGRLRPVLEVFPAARIAGPMAAPRMAKRFPAIFGVRHHLGYDDIVLVRRDDRDDSTDTDEEAFEERNLLAVYSPLKNSEEAEIVLDDGSVWVARPLPNGSLDFVHTGADGRITTARWARRYAAAGVAGPGQACADSSPRYTFSILNPSTRRHPVMATLTPSTLDIQNTYTSIPRSYAKCPSATRTVRSQSLTSSSSVARPLPCPPSDRAPSSASGLGCVNDMETDSAVCIPATAASLDASTPSRTLIHPVDDATKMLITVSAIWVCLRSSWAQGAGGGPASAPLPPTSSCSSSSAPDFNANPAAAVAAIATSSPGRTRGNRRNTWTARCTSTGTEHPAADLPLTSSPATGGSGPKRMSVPTPLPSVQWDASATVVPTPTGPSPVPSRSPTPTAISSASTAPRRATSSGAAYMQWRLRQVSVTSSTVGYKLGGEMDVRDGGGSGDDAGKDEVRLPARVSSGKSSREALRSVEDSDRETGGPARGILKTDAAGNGKAEEEEEEEEEKKKKKKERKRPRPFSDGLTLVFAASSALKEPEKGPASAKTPGFFARGLDETEPRRHSFMLLRRERGDPRRNASVRSRGVGVGKDTDPEKDTLYGAKAAAQGKPPLDGGKDTAATAATGGGGDGGVRSRLVRWMSRKFKSGSGSESKKSR